MDRRACPHGAVSLSVNTIALLLQASVPGTAGSLGEASTVACVVCVIDSKEAAWLTVSALGCFCSTSLPEWCWFQFLKFHFKLWKYLSLKSVLSCPYLLLINHIGISLCQKCCLFLCSFIMIGTDQERRTLEWHCFLWTWSIPVQTSRPGWAVLCLLSPGLHGQCQHVFCCFTLKLLIFLFFEFAKLGVDFLSLQRLSLVKQLARGS